MNKTICFLLCLLIINLVSTGQIKDYLYYHKKIAEIESRIYVEDKIDLALNEYLQLFEQYNFLFLDDCLNAAVLAFYKERYGDAAHFMALASRNGMERYMLSNLMYGWNYDSTNHTLYTKFVNFASPYLIDFNTSENISKLSYYDELKPSCMQALNKRHIYEQLSKDNQINKLLFDSVNHHNILFLDSLAKLGIFMTERNIGFYSEHFYNAVRKGISIADLKNGIFRRDGIYLPSIPADTIEEPNGIIIVNPTIPENYIPTADSIFSLSIPNRNIILFHCDRGYSLLIANHMDTAIKYGFWHPRECAMFYDEEFIRKYNSRDYLMMVSQHAVAENGNVNIALRDSLRHRFYLPSYKVDSLKHIMELELGINLFLNKIVYECR